MYYNHYLSAGLLLEALLVLMLHFLFYQTSTFVHRVMPQTADRTVLLIWSFISAISPQFTLKSVLPAHTTFLCVNRKVCIKLP